MTDLMFSCRVQGKRVEHEFISHLIRKYRQTGALTLLVDYRRTKKNAGPGKVFEDLGFRILGEIGGLTHLAFPADMPIPDDAIITIDDTTARTHAMEPAN
jgi:hypothetical protein